MNPKCPECQVELPEDFGIVTCTNCGAVCSVDLDGNAEVQDEQMQTPGVEIEDPVEGVSLEAVGEDDFETDLEENSTEFEEETLEEESTFEDEPVEEDYIEEPQDELTEDALDNPEEELETFEEQIDEPIEDTQEESFEEDKENLEPLSSDEFFNNLELFSEQLEPQDHHHTYYQLRVSGFETDSDLEEVLELTLDERLGIINESLVFDETHQSFIIPKISFLRLVVVHKRLSTIRFVEMDWALTEDQSDVTDDPSDYAGGSEDTEDTHVGESLEVEEDDDALYEEVDESDF